MSAVVLALSVWAGEAPSADADPTVSGIGWLMAEAPLDPAAGVLPQYWAEGLPEELLPIVGSGTIGETLLEHPGDLPLLDGVAPMDLPPDMLYFSAGASAPTHNPEPAAVLVWTMAAACGWWCWRGQAGPPGAHPLLV